MSSVTLFWPFLAPVSGGNAPKSSPTARELVQRETRLFHARPLRWKWNSSSSFLFVSPFDLTGGHEFRDFHSAIKGEQKRERSASEQCNQIGVFYVIQVLIRVPKRLVTLRDREPLCLGDVPWEKEGREIAEKGHHHTLKKERECKKRDKLEWCNAMSHYLLQISNGKPLEEEIFLFRSGYSLFGSLIHKFFALFVWHLCSRSFPRN